MKRKLAALLVLMCVLVVDLLYAQDPGANTHEHFEKSMGQSPQKAGLVEPDANEEERKAKKATAHIKVTPWKEDS